MMKTRIAMLISVAGVLAAGSAAALVNTQVLGGSASSPQAIDAPAQSAATTAASVPAATTPIPAATTPAATTPVTAAAASTQAVYSIGDAGAVTLDTANDVLTIVAVTPASGWVVSKSETDGATNAEVKFQSGSVEIEFRANLLFGVVTTSVESNDTSVSSTSVDDNGGGGGSGSGRHSGGESDDNGGGSDD